MADNVQTAAEWGQVIENLDLTKRSVLIQLSGVRSNLQTLNSQKTTLISQLSAADQSGDTALVAVIQGRINTVDSKISGATLAASNLVRDVAQIDQDLNNAFSQQSTAAAGPPLDNSTTPPASSLPGDPTDVTLTEQQSIIITTPSSLPAAQTTVNEFGQVVSIENAAPENTTTYYENDGTTGNEIVYPQLTAEEQALAALGDAGAGPGEFSYDAPPPDDTVYYENNGASSTSTPFPQLTPEELALAAQGDAGAGPGEFSYPPSGSTDSTRGLLRDTQSKATQGDVQNIQQERDWRVRLSLAAGATYLYKAQPAGILDPLKATNGVIFPYTPQVSVSYAANYDPTELTHSNYKIFQYRGSAVDQVSITCDFTAQDTFEANYLLAVIHFFRSVTKMFYGQDQKPNIGSPPPLCYLSGLGTFQFNNHPLAITSFNYSLPNDVDYIRATNTTTNAGVNKSPATSKDPSYNLAALRGAPPEQKAVVWNNPPAGSVEPTYVPTKMQIQISAIPVVSRNDISNRFSLADYATGNLLRGNQNSTKGIW